MKLAIFGLAISSSWGNGHATIWRGLCRALTQRGHQVSFFERDVPYYARHRDVHELERGRLVLYDQWPNVRELAERTVRGCDVAIVTSYCPDAVDAAQLVLACAARRVFYDLDSGVTLHNLENGAPVPYVGPNGLADFDLVLSYTGGDALSGLRDRLGARAVVPLYGSVEPDAHVPMPAIDAYRSDLCYLATHADDRHQSVLELFVEPARRLARHRFLLAGPQYPDDFPWQPNVFYIEHVPPGLHPLFYCSSRFTLNLTRRAMAQYGFCPSGRLFEAAAAGVPILTDYWKGLEAFFEPNAEVIVVESTNDVIRALEMPEPERLALTRRARERVLDEHTAAHRARELERILEL
ncbi:MAG: CgeB family protein [Gemmatimonadota bacterium]